MSSMLDFAGVALLATSAGFHSIDRARAGHDWFSGAIPLQQDIGSIFAVCGVLLLIAGRATRIVRTTSQAASSGESKSLPNIAPESSPAHVSIDQGVDVENQPRPSGALDGCASVLAAIALRRGRDALIRSGSRGNQTRRDSGPLVRVWISIVVDRKTLVRITRIFGGPDEDQSAERLQSVTYGPMGLAAQTGRHVCARIPPQSDMVEELVSKWDFPEPVAMSVRPDRRSWFGVPVIWHGQVHAMICADSSEEDFFSSSIQRLLLDASLGVAENLLRDYTPEWVSGSGVGPADD